MADFLHPLGVTRVQHLGIYNYRCIGEGTPPDCPNGISEHALGLAIDLHEFQTATETYNVETDWVIDPDAEATCTAGTESDKDRILHELACAWHASSVFNITLTPNYSADYRNHFHLDLLPGSHFIE